MLIDFPAADPQDAAVGARVRRWRERRGLDPDALADALSLSRERLLSAERGRVHLSSVQLYAATLALHIPMRLLFEDAPERPKPA